MPSARTVRSWAPPIRRKPPPAPCATTMPRASTPMPSTAPMALTPPSRKSRISSKTMSSAPGVNSSAPAAPAKLNLLDLDRRAMEGFFAELGEKPFRATQLIKWIHQRRVADFDAMTDLSKALRAKLSEICEIRLPRAVFDQQSTDGTRKWLLSLDGGNAIETVFIPEPNRGTLCVSSQVGCALECSFCSTATQGFNRNLSVAEIIGQLRFATAVLAEEGLSVTNVVFMGMGEPLLNF